MDVRHVQNSSWSSNFGTNLDLFFIGPIPVPIPTGFKPYATEFNSYKSVSVTKVIQQYGILESVMARDEQSKVTTRNLLWDEGTGEVLLTRTENEYNDPLYNMKYPAYHAYDAMGAAYQNEGLRFEDVTIAEGVITLGASEEASWYFTKGDQLYIRMEEYQRNVSAEIVQHARIQIHGLHAFADDG